MLERCVGDLTRSGAIADDPRAAPLLWSAVHGLAALSLEGAVGTGPEAIRSDVDRLVAILLRGLAPAG